MNPIVVHVVRPYASELEYLAAEAWSIDARTMLLIAADELPTDTAVLFDVALRDGHKPIRAEGRVVGMVPPTGDRPGGLKVRFKRFGAATKAFIERAVKAREQAPSSSATSSTEAAPPPEPALPSSPEVERLSVPELVPAQEPSGVRPRVAGVVVAPKNREELLERLRLRRRGAG
ncbi:MAG TPA: hypothetical protein VEX18_16875 [Polyangiaceae bacterium]|nr:hypothetical protein [Polyangiaceae bacterium]